MPEGSCGTVATVTCPVSLNKKSPTDWFSTVLVCLHEEGRPSLGVSGSNKQASSPDGIKRERKGIPLCFFGGALVFASTLGRLPLGFQGRPFGFLIGLPPLGGSFSPQPHTWPFTALQALTLQVASEACLVDPMEVEGKLHLSVPCLTQREKLGWFFRN